MHFNGSTMAEDSYVHCNGCTVVSALQLSPGTLCSTTYTTHCNGCTVTEDSSGIRGIKTDPLFQGLPPPCTLYTPLTFAAIIKHWRERRWRKVNYEFSISSNLPHSACSWLSLRRSQTRLLTWNISRYLLEIREIPEIMEILKLLKLLNCLIWCVSFITQHKIARFYIYGEKPEELLWCGWVWIFIYMRTFYEIGFCPLCFKYKLCNVKGNPMLSGDNGGLNCQWLGMALNNRACLHWMGADHMSERDIKGRSWARQ